MKPRLILLAFISNVLLSFTTIAQTQLSIFHEVLFYDGYAATVSSALPPGVIRHRNDLIARKLSSQELQSIGTTLSMKVVVKAVCDNYDRIGNVNLALVPAGATTYNPGAVSRIELGRYITPFMNKNVMPDTVPYNYTIDNVASLLKETSLTSQYDIWIELELFGVPYAANTQVAGCSGRNDVFKGSLYFTTSGPTQTQNNNFLLPLAFKKDLNNYTASATDTMGKTTKFIQFSLPANLTNATLYLITSNHGANSGGEEYNRRMHYIYADGNVVLQYKPGRSTCEPFRVYNTQANGIYGSSPQSPSQWQSFSNWCPGDVIDIRTINLNTLTAGQHSFGIRVPTAVFNGGQGNIPFSVYLQGKSTTIGLNDESDFFTAAISAYPNPVNSILHISSTTTLDKIKIMSLFGQELLSSALPDIDVSAFEPGLYFIQAHTTQGQILMSRVIKQ